MTDVPVSVVICTLNRAKALRDLLISLRQQWYQNFEVVVVVGPCADETDAVLDEFGSTIRVVRNPLANLSVSRNLGIDASAGEFVAFIDDDAIPEPMWLAHLVASFDDEQVVGVGGLVLERSGCRPEYLYCAVDRFGDPEFSLDHSYDHLCVPGSPKFPFLAGCNAMYRRSALVDAGGFDEAFAYHLEEPDLSCRLIDAGYRIRQIDNAPVRHLALSSAIRDDRSVITDWSPIVRSRAYFGSTHSSGPEVAASLERYVDWVTAVAQRDEDAGGAPDGHTEATRRNALRAAEEGQRLAAQAGVVPSRMGAVIESFVRFPTVSRAQNALRVALAGDACEERTWELARSLAARGHEVRLLVTALGAGQTELVEGVWLHVVPNVPTLSTNADGMVDQGSTSLPRHLADELDRVAGWFVPDVVVRDLQIVAERASE